MVYRAGDHRSRVDRCNQLNDDGADSSFLVRKSVSDHSTAQSSKEREGVDDVVLSRVSVGEERCVHGEVVENRQCHSEHLKRRWDTTWC